MRSPLVPWLILFLMTADLAFPAENADNSFTIEAYVKTVMTQGTRAVTAYKNFENSTLGYKVSYRQSRMPSLSLDSSVTKNKTDTDSIIVHQEGASGSATLSQPFYATGAKISASVSENTSQTETLGTVSQSYTKPAYQASFTQPLYLFVGNSEWRSWKRADISYQIAKDNYQRDLQSIENDARAHYYDVLLKKAQLDVEKEKLEASKRAKNVTAALVEAGRLAGLEQARSEVRYQQDVRRLQNAETALQQSINEAAELASLKINVPIDFTSKLTYALMNISLPSLVNFALAHRPDYIAAKRQLELSELNVKTTEESDNPLLNAVASVQHSQIGTNAATSNINSWSGTLNLSWLLFDSRVTHLQVMSAKNSLENDRVALQTIEKSIRKEVANAFLGVKANEAQMDDLVKSKEQAKASVEAVRIRYQNGRDRLIDVFDSEQSLRDLELEYLNVIISANLAKEQLALLVGGKLEEVPQ